MQFRNSDGTCAPRYVKLKKGAYFYCRCGQTETPPFCDGHHKYGRIIPLKFKADGKTTVKLCTCGRTRTPPVCDRSEDLPPGGLPHRSGTSL